MSENYLFATGHPKVPPFAYAALFLGLAGIMFCIPLFGPPSIFAGAVAMMQVRYGDGNFKGSNTAVCGLSAGLVATFLPFILLGVVFGVDVFFP